MRKLLIPVALLGLALQVHAQTTFPYEQIHGFGDKKNRINLVIVGDGWSQADLDSGAYKRAVAALKDGILKHEPLKLYQNFLTITRIDVPSPRSGVTHEYVWMGETAPRPGAAAPTGGVSSTAFTPPTSWNGLQTMQFAPTTWTQPGSNRIFRQGPIMGSYYQTYFYTARDTSNNIVMVNRSVWMKDNLSDGAPGNRWQYGTMLNKIKNTMATELPRNVTAVLVNSTIPGGAAVEGVFCFSNETHISETFVHELGHALARLGDEYIERNNEPTDALPADSVLASNVTTQPNKNLVKWKHWYGSEGIGDPVEGGLLRSRGVWRPKAECMMKNHTTSEFCAVCKEDLVRKMLIRVSLIDGKTPAEKDLSMTTGGSQTFKVTCVGPAQNKFEADWFFDGRPVKGTKSDTARGPVFEVTLGSDVLIAGTHTVSVVVKDKTPLIKDAKEGDTAYKRKPSEAEWNVQVREPSLLPRLLRWLFGF